VKNEFGLVVRRCGKLKCTTAKLVEDLFNIAHEHQWIQKFDLTNKIVHQARLR